MEDENEPVASTSYGTLRGVPSTMTSAASPNLHIDTDSVAGSTSGTGSQPSSALPSPPDSPDSLSSFPSMASSFFFSSAAASPPHSAEGGDSTAGLIIPSLELPAALRAPTPHGRALGEVRLLVLGDHASFLLEGNEDVVERGIVQQLPGVPGGSALRASTDWVEVRDGGWDGAERFEGRGNVEIVEVTRTGEVSLVPPLLVLLDGWPSWRRAGGSGRSGFLLRYLGVAFMC